MFEVWVGLLSVVGTLSLCKYDKSWGFCIVHHCLISPFVSLLHTQSSTLQMYCIYNYVITNVVVSQCGTYSCSVYSASLM